MNRRLFVAFAIASPLALRAQPARKPVRIGVLSSTSPEARSKYWDAFKEAMAKLGWAEGRDVTYVYRYTRGFLHQKVLLMDRQMASVGSFRSRAPSVNAISVASRRGLVGPSAMLGAAP